MNGTRHPVELRESDGEMLLFIHASQKERAKRIDGRRWDPGRCCWVYPKTANCYDAIIGEFGDDMTPCQVERPAAGQGRQGGKAAETEAERLRRENGDGLGGGAQRQPHHDPRTEYDLGHRFSDDAHGDECR
jgi:hypothetical protein